MWVDVTAHLGLNIQAVLPNERHSPFVLKYSIQLCPRSHGNKAARIEVLKKAKLSRSEVCPRSHRFEIFRWLYAVLASMSGVSKNIWCSSEGVIPICFWRIGSSEKCIRSAASAGPHAIDAHIELSDLLSVVDQQQGIPRKLTHHQPK